MSNGQVEHLETCPGSYHRTEISPRVCGELLAPARCPKMVGLGSCWVPPAPALPKPAPPVLMRTVSSVFCLFPVCCYQRGWATKELVDPPVI